jgi:SAM-dependent MidA family methyltransferase
MPDESIIPFDEFMRQALYDPHKGYYSRHIPGLGRRGDFTTVPVATNALASRIASWIEVARLETGCRDIIEIGPGEGQLTQAIRQHLPWLTRLRCRFHLVDISPPLRAAQQKRLGKKARWHDSIQAALAACNGRALIYSNELVDAFPVRRFQNTSTGWRELGVLFTKNAAPRESLLPPASLPDSSAFSIPHPDGQVIEVHDSYRIWLESWIPLWNTGRMLTIDYGNTTDLLYHRQPLGTLRAYLLHQRITGPGTLENQGRQDLTADVNFTDLMQWTSRWMNQQQLANLRDFCGNDAPAWLREENGPGHAFLVLDELRRTS